MVLIHRFTELFVFLTKTLELRSLVIHLSDRHNFWLMIDMNLGKNSEKRCFIGFFPLFSRKNPWKLLSEMGFIWFDGWWHSLQDNRICRNWSFAENGEFKNHQPCKSQKMGGTICHRKLNEEKTLTKKHESALHPLKAFEDPERCGNL